ncbi:hypothetical protein [Reichenbachiella sp.]|uniref:hypothetical protein n=1 Tax=Reichenbachiella sp. TaxID=2184521 RepID=UPI003BAE35DA
MKTNNFWISILALTIVFGCNDEEDTDINPTSDPNVSHYKGTQAPGDIWDWVLDYNHMTFSTTWDHGTFDDTSDDIAVEGTFITLPSGYLKCTINKSTPSNGDIPEDGSAYFFAMNLPNMTMIIKPEGSIKGDLIAAVATGECNDVPGDYNYIMVAPGNMEAYDPVTEEAYGVASFVDNGNGFAISGEGYSLDCANEGVCTSTSTIQGLPVAECQDNGAIKIMSDGATAIEGQFTGAGVMMIDRGEGNGGVLAVQQSGAYEFNDLVDADMVGFAYMPANEEETIVPVHLVFKDEGNVILGKASKINDIVTGELEAKEPVSIRVDAINNGLLDGDITHSDGLGTNFVAAMLESEGEKMLILSSTSTNGDPFILITVTKRD